MKPILKLESVSKSYGSVQACVDVNMQVEPGEVHGLIGENGAGKSTLVKIIYGLVRADAGIIEFNGDNLSEHHPVIARRAGISLVFQHFALFEPLTVLENIRLGLSDDVDYESLRTQIQTIVDRYEIQVDADRTVSSLSVSEKQRVEILRCLVQSPKLLMMDEPTSVLTPQEIEHLLHLIQGIASKGCAVLFISHKLHEVKQICKRITVMRRGRVVLSSDVETVEVGQMAEHMIGEKLTVIDRKATAQDVDSVLQVADFSQSAENDTEIELRNIDFSVHAGEIVGIAGIAGNGQNELLAALSGERRSKQSSSIRLRGQPIGHLGPAARRRLGVGFVPEDRLQHGSVAAMSLTENVLLTAWNRTAYSKFGLLNYAAASRFAGRIVDQFDVRSNALSDQATQLSGGNLQKFIVGREILLEPEVLIVAHPTWGVDAAAALVIRRALVNLANDGSAVLVVSQDLDELLEIVNRLAVISGGCISPTFVANEISATEIGLLMAGDTALNSGTG